MNTEPGEACVIRQSTAQMLHPAETHCHTSQASPCGTVPAEYMVKEYLSEHYRYLFITDHMHEVCFETDELKGKSWEELADRFLSGYRTAKKAAEGTDLIVMLGMEVTLKGKSPIDFLVYGEDEQFIYDHPFLYDTDFESFNRLVHENGFLSFQAHPYRYGGEPVQPVCYDGIEIFNAHPRHLSRNQKAVQFAREKGLYVISGSDAHAEEDIARGGVMLPDGIESGADFVCYIKEHGSPELIITFQ
jgi:predicted metal-dependent phosphoesterase TrpH